MCDASCVIYHIRRSAWPQIAKFGWSPGGFEHSGAEAEQREGQDSAGGKPPEPAAAGVILHSPFTYSGDAVSWRTFMRCVAPCVFVFQLQAEPTRLGPVSRERAEESVAATGHTQPPPSPRIPRAVPS